MDVSVQFEVEDESPIVGRLQVEAAVSGSLNRSELAPTDAKPAHALRQYPAMAKYRWSVRIGSEEGEEVATDYEWSQPFGEPDVGDVFSLPDGSGPWRVADMRKRDVPDSPGNILIVEGAEG